AVMTKNMQPLHTQTHTHTHANTHTHTPDCIHMRETCCFFTCFFFLLCLSFFPFILSFRIASPLLFTTRSCCLGSLKCVCECVCVCVVCVCVCVCMGHSTPNG